MKKISFIGNVRYVGAILIVLQGILLAMFAIFMLNSLTYGQLLSILFNKFHNNFYFQLLWNFLFLINWNFI